MAGTGMAGSRLARVVGLVMLTLVPGEVGGSETYARGLARALAARGEADVTAFVPPDAPDAGAGLPTTVVNEFRPPGGMGGKLGAMASAVVRPGPLRRRIGRLDTVHYPFTVALPRLDVPAAVTLHDIQHLDLPHLFSRAERVYRAAAYHRSARRARIVIVPSAFVRDRVVARLGLPAHKLRVIHLGLDHSRFSPGTDERDPFLVYPARPWPHKNHARLFEAFALVRRERPELRLVLTGSGDFGQVPDGVEVRGQVPDDDLVSLYRRAAALVFPSLYEGFGQPPLEAMACGCPAAVARAGSLPEVCGDSARYFDPNAPEDIAAAVRDVLDAPDEWRRRGLDQAARYAWDCCAAAHEQVYAELEA
jgi:glycosyltransferase involved in cell wall biosynthesis